MSVSESIEKMISGFPDWRGELLTQMRRIVNESDPELVEEWKWDVPVWTKNGMVCAISGFKDHVKINFFKGAKLEDPYKLINAGLESKAHRAIDFFEGDKIKESELKDLIIKAIALNSK